LRGPRATTPRACQPIPFRARYDPVEQSSANAPPLRTSGTTRSDENPTTRQRASAAPRRAKRALPAGVKRRDSPVAGTPAETQRQAGAPTYAAPRRGIARQRRGRRRIHVWGGDIALQTSHCSVRFGGGAKMLLGSPIDPSCPPRIFERNSSATTEASAPLRMI
jgi:hypothetical protein